MQIFIIFSLFIAILAVIFALQNTMVVTVSFLFWHFTGSLALVLLAALATGAVVSILASIPSLVRNQISSRSQKKKITESEATLNEHKTRLEEAQKKAEELQHKIDELLHPAPELPDESEKPANTLPPPTV